MRLAFVLFLAACDADAIGLGAKDDTAADPEDIGGPATATAPLYVNDASTLYTWDTASLTATAIGPIIGTDGVALPSFADIAIDADGRLYGASGSAIYRIDAETAVATYTLSAPDAGTGLTVLPDGRLLVAGAGLTAVDFDTGDTEIIVAPGAYSTSGDVVAVPDGTVHWSVLTGGLDAWVVVDPDGGGTELRGDTGVAGLWGVAYADGGLYAFASNGGVYDIDAGSGAGTLLVTTGITFYGATTNPVAW